MNDEKVVKVELSKYDCKQVIRVLHDYVESLRNESDWAIDLGEIEYFENIINKFNV